MSTAQWVTTRPAPTTSGEPRWIEMDHRHDSTRPKFRLLGGVAELHVDDSVPTRKLSRSSIDVEVL